MRKKLFYFLVVACSLFNGILYGQTGYNFSYSNTTYNDLVSPTNVVNNSGFTGSSFQIPIGFNFHYWGVAYTKVYITTTAYIDFDGVSYGFYPFYTNLKGIGNSSINYILDNSGGAGKRILKMEWREVGFTADASNTDTASVQMWLYETSDIIEFHFGKNSIKAADYMKLFGSASGNSVVVAKPDLSDFYNLQGSASGPTAIEKPTSFLYLTGYPDKGMTYTYKPKTTAVSQIPEKKTIEIYPNPANNDLSIAYAGNAIVTIYNMAGVVLYTDHMYSQPITINTNKWADGNYIISINDGNTLYTKNVIIKH